MDPSLSVAVSIKAWRHSHGDTLSPTKAHLFSGPKNVFKYETGCWSINVKVEVFLLCRKKLPRPDKCFGPSIVQWSKLKVK